MVNAGDVMAKLIFVLITWLVAIKSFQLKQDIVLSFEH